MRATLRDAVPAPQRERVASITTPASASNRLVIPALGIDAIHGTSGCTGNQADALAAGLYQLQCQGIASTYLASHNWSTLNAVQIAYRAGVLPVGTQASYTDSTGTTRAYVLTEAFDLDRHFVNSPADAPTRLALFAPCDGCLVMQTCWDGSASVPSTRWLFTRWVRAG